MYKAPLRTAPRALQPLPVLPRRSPPHFIIPSLSRPVSTTPAREAYRRFGNSPRGPTSPYKPQRGRREVEEEERPEPLRTLLANLPRQRGGQGSSYGPGGGGGRRGFSFHNARVLATSPLFLVVAGGGATYVILHLEQVPETGRWRFIDVSREMERSMGDDGFKEILQEYRGKVLPDWSPEARHVQAVVKRIVRANGLEESLGQGKGFVTHVVKEDQTKNAFVLPNGHIFVFTGILDVAKDADGLAVVLGHEIAHQVARHSAERMSGMKIFYGLALLLSSLGIDFGISQLFLNYTLTLPNSRKNETEADLIGLRLANAACFDIREGEHLWQRMGAAEEAPGVDMSFLSTHPSSKNRTVKVREWAQEIIKDRPEECGPLREQVPAFQRASGLSWAR
ncbi:hypothetical protein JCM8547_000824 [Rhodosporidiobolus lusitaniae]